MSCPNRNVATESPLLLFLGTALVLALGLPVAYLLRAAGRVEAPAPQAAKSPPRSRRGAVAAG